MDKYERKIIEDEIKRLEKKYEDAHELYGITGSASTDHTMHKYDVLKTALENYLYHRQEDTDRKMIIQQQEQLLKLKNTINRFAITGKIPADAANVLTNIIMRG